MIKKILSGIFFLLFFSVYVQSQVITVSSGTCMVIKTGTAFFTDNLVLTPSADYTLSNTTLSRNTVVIHPAVNPYIARVYSFSNTTQPFSGILSACAHHF